jgi:hypothetical protein
MKPFRQGDLDGLCGVYAVLNALKALGYRENHEGWQVILSEIITYLHESKESTFFFTDGINTPDMSRILKHIACLNRDIVYSKPFHSKADITLSELWDTLSLYLNSKIHRTAILCVQGHHCGHWTVVSSLSKKRITFFDSSDMEWVNRSRCTTTDLTTNHSILLYPATLFLLERSTCQKE